jgi:hypothetical protein
MALPRPDGTYLIVPGTTADTCTNTTNTYLFDPNQMQFKLNGASGLFTTNGTGPGAFAFQRTDGMYVIFKGGGTSGTCVIPVVTSNIQIYNPINNRMITVAGGIVVPTPASSTTLKPYGGFAMPMANGTWAVAVGLGSNVKYNLYDEKSGVIAAAEGLPNGGLVGVFYQATAATGPTAFATTSPSTGAPSATTYNGFGPGAIGFQRPDGKFLVIAGSASTTASSTVTSKFDAGWVSTGLYKTEQIQVPNLDANSVLNWKITPSYTGVTAEVRTASSQLGLQDAPARSIAGPGQKINPNSGDTWLQVTFNFKRDFPSYTGVYSDVWYNGATPIATQRAVTTPLLTEISVTQDIDFINLKADGQSMLRISSNGNLYAADGATLNTSGADLAERYTSQVPLENGTVVSIDPTNNHGVMPTTYQYQPDALGVVSTDPGFVAGAYTKNSYPIALIGRVPVKVSTENGLIRQGDKLTPASIPGYAMRATLAGHVIGSALESFDPMATSTGACPDGGVQSAARICGSIMMFVNLNDYLGASVDDSLAAYNSRSIADAIAIAVPSTDASTTATTTNDGTISLELGSTTPAAIVNETKQSKILSFLQTLKTNRAETSAYRSELFADRITAVSEIIAPSLFTKSLTTETIDGLTVLTSKKIVADEVSAKAFNIYLDASTTPSVSLTADGLIVAKIGTASTSIDILSDANFFGRPYFTRDTAGSALIKAGKKTVDIVFDREYIDTPIVSATIALESASSTDEDAQAIFDQDIRFLVNKKNVHGFTIILNKPAPTNMSFSWIALAVKNAALFTSKDDAPIVPVVPVQIPAVVVPPTETSTTSTSTDSLTGISQSLVSSTTTQPVASSTSQSTPASIEATSTTTPVVTPTPTATSTETVVVPVATSTSQTVVETPVIPTETPPSTESQPTNATSAETPQP